MWATVIKRQREQSTVMPKGFVCLIFILLGHETSRKIYLNRYARMIYAVTLINNRFVRRLAAGEMGHFNKLHRMSTRIFTFLIQRNSIRC